MSPRQAAWLVALAMLTLLVVFSAPAFPQEGREVPADDSAAAPAAAAADARKPSAQETTVEEILKQQEQLLQGQGFTYDAGTRRDPFLSLYAEIKRDASTRPPGVRGMYIDEIDLVGIVQDPSGGDVAYFTGSDNKGYFLRVGDRVFDGALIAIDPRRGSVTFRQQIDDPRQIKPYRDVVRTLEPVEESTND